MSKSKNKQPRASIWDRVGKSAFETSIDLLHSTRCIPESQVLKKADWPEPRDIELLPFEIEKQLSDDIAFISAFECGPTYVTAATVEVCETGGLLVRLAANKGICPVVEQAWTHIIPSLERCAKKGQ
jgi:hypothetical protein